jgi:hypothetical protein
MGNMNVWLTGAVEVTVSHEDWESIIARSQSPQGPRLIPVTRVGSGETIFVNVDQVVFAKGG